MTDTLLLLVLLGLALNIAILVAVFRRRVRVDLTPLHLRFESLLAQSDRLDRALREELGRNRSESADGLRTFGDSIQSRNTELASMQGTRFDGFSAQIAVMTRTNEERLETMRQTIEHRLAVVQDDVQRKLASAREESSAGARSLRDEIRLALKNLSDSLVQTIDSLTQSNEAKLESLRIAMDQRLQSIQENNTTQLEQMRATVDEKLQGTLEKRLGESFQQVSDRLEQVHKGLGEMQTLATGVGDLKRVLTNVKTRGGWGEVQLGAILEQILTPEQFERNVRVKDSTRESVEYAVRLPGPDGQSGRPMYLPIDAKFPIEDYQRLLEAHERADPEAAEAAGRALEISVRNSAKLICEKYLNPPATTDFGIMFLPNEGLYAEIARRTGVVETIQRECRVIIAGPTTLAALLNSLQMGFRTLAIQQRSSEVWELLSAVKTHFGRFGTALDGVRKKLAEASNKMDDAAIKSRKIEKRLKEVQQMPEPDANLLLPLGIEEDVDPDADKVQ